MPALQFGIDWPDLVKTNVEKVRRGLEERGIDLLLVNNIDNVRYLTGYSPCSAAMLVHSNWAAVARREEHPILFGFDFYVNSIKRGFPWIKDVRPLPASMPETVKELAAAHGATRGRIGFDGYLLHFVGKEIERLLPDAEIVNADDAIFAARTIKCAQELKILDRCIGIAEMGMKAGIASCVEGKTEYEVAAATEYAMRSAGAEGLAVSAVIMSGENAAHMQEFATDKYLRNGEAVLLDFGCMFEGYYSDFARTVLVGDRVTIPEQRTVYQIVRDSTQKAIDHIRPGVKCGTLEEVARGVIREAGYGEYEYKHFLGHGIGMCVWEYPIISVGSEDKLQAGMVVNVEPGIFKPGVGGFRIEDTVLVTDDGHEVLTKSGYCEAFS